MRRKQAKPKSIREDWHEGEYHFTRFTRRYGTVFTYSVIGTKYL